MDKREDVDYVSARTRLYGIVGDPIVQVRSPEMITAELVGRGVDAVLVPLHLKPDAFDRGMAGLMALENLDGLVFTIPYKARAIGLASTLGPQALRVGAINALGRTPGGWHGEIYDGLGCVEAFRRRGIPIRGRRVQLIGAGGAGAAIGVAVASEHPAVLRLHDLDPARVHALAAKVREVDPAIVVETGPATIEHVDVLMNASPVGMLEDARLPMQVDQLPASLVVFDAVVKPETTPLLALAASQGCTTVRGREMMLGQIARMVDGFLSAL